MKKYFAAFTLSLALLVSIRAAGADTQISLTTLINPEAPFSGAVPKGWVMFKDKTAGYKAILPGFIENEGCRKAVGLHRRSEKTTGRFGDPKIRLWDWLGPNTVFAGAAFNCPAVAGNDVSGGIMIYAEPAISTVDDLRKRLQENSRSTCQLTMDPAQPGSWSVVENDPSSVETVRPTSSCWIVNEMQNGAKLEGFYNAKTKNFIYWLRPQKELSSDSFPHADEEFRIEPLGK